MQIGKNRKLLHISIVAIMAVFVIIIIFTTGCTQKSDADHFYNEGIYYNNHNNQFEKALDNFNKSVESDPTNAKTWFARSIALYNLKRYNESLDSLNRTVTIEPDYVSAWYQEGEILRMLGRNNDANQSYAKAKELGFTG